MTKIRVRTKAPGLLDDTIQQLPGCVARVVEGSIDGDVCTIDVEGGEGFLRFAITRQGYGEIVEEAP